MTQTLCGNRQKTPLKVPGMYQTNFSGPARAATGSPPHGPAKHHLAGKSAAQNRAFSNDAPFSVETQRFLGSHEYTARGECRRRREKRAPASPSVSEHMAQMAQAAGPPHGTRRNLFRARHRHYVRAKKWASNLVFKSVFQDALPRWPRMRYGALRWT